MNYAFNHIVAENRKTRSTWMTSCNDVMRLQINVRPKLHQASHEPAISSAVFHFNSEDTAVPDIRDVSDSVAPEKTATSSKRRSRLNPDEQKTVNSFSG